MLVDCVAALFCLFKCDKSGCSGSIFFAQVVLGQKPTGFREAIVVQHCIFLRVFFVKNGLMLDATRESRLFRSISADQFVVADSGDLVAGILICELSFVVDRYRTEIAACLFASSQQVMASEERTFRLEDGQIISSKAAPAGRNPETAALTSRVAGAGQ